MSDRIELTGIEVVGRHGVLPEEQERGQLFRVDVSIYTDLRRPGASDELGDTIDYAAVADRVRSVVAAERHRLIERVAERVAEEVLSRPGVDRVQVTVHKPGAPLPMAFADVSVTIDRSR